MMKQYIAANQPSKPNAANKIRKLNGLIEAVCGIYTRVARRLGVRRTYVSRVARGEMRAGCVPQHDLHSPV